MDYLKIKDNNDLLRDAHSNAIININMSEYDKYIEIKNIKNKSSQKIEKIESDLNELKSNINEIKNLLKKILT
jgi:hypothetical protein